MHRDLRAIVERGELHICGVSAAIIGGAIVGGSLISANATSDAADTAASTAAANNALQKEIYDKNTANLQPFLTTGTGALGRLDASQQPGFDWNAFLASDPAAQFRLAQGIDAVDRSAAAGGSLDSGGTLKALTRFGQGVATDEINNWWNRNSQLAQFGLSGANALAGVGTNYANAVGSNNNNAATVEGNAALAGANQINGLIGQGINAYGLYRGANSFAVPAFAGPGVDAFGASEGAPADLVGLF